MRVCALEFDFDLLDEGDHTIITDRGMNLSGGQQARINLARAIYKDSDIYLLDDSLTALDPQVQDFIFEECIQKFLANKIVVLVTQTAHHIKHADNVIVLNSGKVKSRGKPSKELLQEVSRYVISVSTEEESKASSQQDEVEEKLEEDSPLKQEPQQTGEEGNVFEEINKKGKVSFSIYKKYFNYGGGMMVMVFTCVVFGLSQGTESSSDMLLTDW